MTVVKAVWYSIGSSAMAVACSSGDLVATHVKALAWCC